MAKEKGTCLHYHFEGAGGCDLGKECSYWHLCQTCPQWMRKPGSGIPRPDLRRQKLDRARKKERWD